MRYVILGLALVCAVAASALVYGRWATTPQDDGQSWRQRHLVFLKAALDRVEADLERQPAGAASLRREQQDILDAMTAIANPAPAGSPPDNEKPPPPAPDAPKDIVLATLDEAVAIERPI